MNIVTIMLTHEGQSMRLVATQEIIGALCAIAFIIEFILVVTGLGPYVYFRSL